MIIKIICCLLSCFYLFLSIRSFVASRKLKKFLKSKYPVLPLDYCITPTSIMYQNSYFLNECLKLFDGPMGVEISNSFVTNYDLEHVENFRKDREDHE